MRFGFENGFPEIAPAQSEHGGENHEAALGWQVLRFEKLLSTEPVDLARISTEIRAHPEMEALATRLLVSLALSSGEAAGSIEEAAVSLGTDRLRVLVYMWSLLQRKPPAAGFWGKKTPREAVPSTEAAGAGAPLPDANPESLYLSSFVHWLGLDLSAPGLGSHKDPRLNHGIYAERVAGLTETLARDFLSLLPFLAPGAAPAEPEAAAR